MKETQKSLFTDMLAAMSTRCSVRKYALRDIDHEQLCQLLEAAARTQTMGNLQLYSVVVTRNDSMKRKLSPAHFNQPMVTAAPVVLTFCADYHRTTEWCRLRKANPGYDNLLSFLNAATDALLYCQTFCNLAEAAGMGICYLGTTIYQPQHIIDTLQLPELVMPVATITLGWPDESPNLTDRLPHSAYIHHEQYAAVTADTIERDYAAKEALPENREFVRVNNKETLAQIFTDIRYTREACETMSNGLMETLRKQKFL